MKEVKLSRSEFVTLVDDEDFERVSKYSWYAEIRKNGQRYVKGAVDGKVVRLHRFVLNLQPGVGEVDHEDGNGFNNQKRNLIVGTKAENMRGGRKHWNARSRYRGVQLVKGKWRAILWLGAFETEEQAAEAYLKAYHGYFGHPPRHPSREK